jgi:hypothetical protein
MPLKCVSVSCRCPLSDVLTGVYNSVSCECPLGVL